MVAPGTVAERFTGRGLSRSGRGRTSLPPMPRTAAVGWPLLLVLLALVLVPLHVRGYTALSPVDELQHLDYVERSPGLQPVVSGDRIGQEALRAEACRSVDAPFIAPPCGLPRYDPEQFQEQGYNTAYIHPPTYYGLTAVLAAPLEATLNLSTLTAARLVGAAWLALGLVLSWVLAVRLGASCVAATGVLLLVGATPAVLYWAAVVNPDAASLAVGATCTLLVLAWERRPSGGWWLLALAGVLGVAIKLQNLLVLLALGTYLLARAMRRAWAATSGGDAAAGDAAARTPRQYLLAVPALGVPGILVAVGWTALTLLRAAVPPDELPMAGRFAVEAFPLSGLIGAVGVFLPPVKDPYLPTFLSQGMVYPVVQVAAALLLAAVVAAGLFRVAGPRVADLGVAVLTLSLLGGPVLVLLNAVVNGTYFGIPPRYGLALVAPAAALAAVLIRGRRTGIGLLAVGVVGAVLVAVGAVR
jgi:Dolichyl-phosphate-mannose-protein mannosyltransferase